MVKKSNFKSFWVVVLLFAEATQAVTPDVASLASSRLFQIVGAIADRGESWVTHCQPVRDLTIRTATSPPPAGSVPLEDRSQENEPDQVCLASCRLGFQLPGNEAGKSHKSQHVAFDPDKLWVRSGRLGSACVSDPVPWSCALIYSLCRMTC
jgi:hypothetical protein